MNDQNDLNPERTLLTAFSVLTQAVAQSTHAGHFPRASQVRLAMKHMTYDGFNPTDLGFRRFRDFLFAAQDAGQIVIREQPGDLQVLLPGAVAESVGSNTRVRRDIWRAFVDWNPEALHYLDLDTGKALEIPRRPVDLEPAKFAEIRQRAASDDRQLVRIPSVPVGEQIRWMRQFSEEIDDDSLRNLLLGALAGDKPAKNFTSIVRADSAEQRRWNHFFGERVLASVAAWADADERLSNVEVFGAAMPHEEEAAESDEVANMPSATRGLIDAASRLVAPKVEHFGPSGRVSRGASAGTTETRLRALIHRAVDRMSEDELRSLRLPVGSLIDEG